MADEEFELLYDDEEAHEEHQNGSHDQYEDEEQYEDQGGRDSHYPTEDLPASGIVLVYLRVQAGKLSRY